jgi:hypothetical protein
VLIEPDGSVRIAWSADGFESIHVLARFRSRPELEGYARAVADAALINRSVRDLRVALRDQFPGDFDLTTREPRDADWRVVVSFHPPKGEPNPDPY